MPSGGKRAGSGRKSNQEIQTIRTAIENNISPKQWDTIIRKLYALAEKGNIRATQILITYRFGASNAALAEPDPEPEVTFGHDATHWHIDLYEQGNHLMVYHIDENNATFDEKGNVIISRNELYIGTPPPYVPRDQHGLYTSRKD